MKSKHILYSLLTFLLISISYSCNSNDSYTYGPTDSYSNAQIYKFSVSRALTTKNDTILSKTFFHIDQKSERIYNTDSLPYKMSIKNLLPKLSFASSETPSKTEVIYRNLPDSVVTLADGDSIDFSRNDVSLRITAQNGTSRKEYIVDMAVHQINPDSIVWKQIPLSGTIAGDRRGKVLLKENKFYRYFLSGGTITLQTASRNNINPLSWTTETLSGLNNNIRLDDIIISGGSFYAIDDAGKAYSSANGLTWASTGSSTPYVYRIIGILPGADITNDSILVVTRNGSDYYFEKTPDLKVFKQKTIINNLTVFDKDKFMGLLSSDYSSFTYYDRSNLNSNLLSVIGTKTPGSAKRNGWLFTFGTNGLNIIKSGGEISAFDNDKDFNGFIYNKEFFALSNNAIYTSVNWGNTWKKAPIGYSLVDEMKTSQYQSIIVDDEDFIWIFGEMNSQYVLWRGRLNKLIK